MIVGGLNLQAHPDAVVVLMPRQPAEPVRTAGIGQKHRLLLPTSPKGWSA